jgi:hypothetical protein
MMIRCTPITCRCLVCLCLVVPLNNTLLLGSLKGCYMVEELMITESYVIRAKDGNCKLSNRLASAGASGRA